MTRLAFVLLSTLPLTGCTSNDQESDKNSQKNDTLVSNTTKKDINSTTVDTTFRLDFFKSVPDTIDGCGEYFTYDTSKIANDKYIFLSNLTDFAIIKINGKNIYLNRDTIESKEISSKSYIAVYTGQGYKAILTIKQTKTYAEGGLYTGTLQIISDKIKAIFKVHGEAGC